MVDRSKMLWPGKQPSSLSPQASELDSKHRNHTCILCSQPLEAIREIEDCYEVAA